MKPDFTLKLIEWNRTANHRPMPWKGEKDPYRVWLSEVILQQTRVEQGWAYYERFITAFPTVRDLAAAEDVRVFKLWEGLGYYSRCKNLLATARTIVDEHAGVFPSSYLALLALRGIGPYTAAAIASFAFDEPRAVIDGNVQRVLSRYFGSAAPVDTPAGKKVYQELAAALLDVDAPAEYNQAIMDFGATICKPKQPLCPQCIQKDDCEALKLGVVNRLPVKEKLIKRTNRFLYYFILEQGNQVYIRKRTQGDIWQDLHEFVLHERDEPADDPSAEFLSDLLQHQSYTIRHVSKPYSQQLSHQRIYGKFFVVTIHSREHLLQHFLLVDKKDISNYAFPKFINSFLLDTPLSP